MKSCFDGSKGRIPSFANSVFRSGFYDFAPYVASLNDAGRVAFQAECGDGSSGIFVVNDGEAQSVVRTHTGEFTALRRHPDISNCDAVCFLQPDLDATQVHALHGGG